MADWKHGFNTKVHQYMYQYIREQEDEQGTSPPVQYVYSFWRRNKRFILSEIELLIDDASEQGRKEGLQELAIAIREHAMIENTNPNIHHVFKLIQGFIKETEQEVDYSNDDEDGEGMEESS